MMTGDRQPECKRVLVLGEETRMVLPILRSLGRRGLEVHLAWCLPNESCVRSRYMHRFHELRPWRPDNDGWLDDLGVLLGSTSFDLVIPATEPAVYALQRAREKLDKSWPIHLLNQEAFETFFDKERTHELARSLDIAAPRQTVLRLGDDWREQLSDWSMPLALKPTCSVAADNVNAKNFVRRVRDRRELSCYLEQLSAQGDPVIVQEWFEGVGAGVEFLAHQGEVLFAFQHERIHETLGYGSTYRKSAALNPDLLDATRALVAATHYTGVGMAEYRVDPRTGRFVLLEVNARFWGSLPLAVAAGGDFPAYLYDMVMHGRRAFPKTYRHGVRCRDLISDVRWMWRALIGADASADAGWAMNPVRRARVVADIARALTPRDCVDTFAWDDVSPAFADIVQLFRTAWSSTVQRLRGRTAGDFIKTAPPEDQRRPRLVRAP